MTETRLCDSCMGVGITIEAAPIDISGLSGAQRMEASRLHKKLRVPWNKLKRMSVTCPCGARFLVPESGWGARRRYCSQACKKKYFRPGSIARKWPLPEGFDDELRTIYENEVLISSPSKGIRPVYELAERYGIPRWKVTRRAQELGLIRVQRKQPPWSEEELEVLKKVAHLNPLSICRNLASNGFKRSVNAVALKLTRTGLRAFSECYSAREAARIFGVDSNSIKRWIERGYLPASKRGTARTEKQGGDIWTIELKAIRDFIADYTDLVDFRKVDKYFVARLLKGEIGNE